MGEERPQDVLESENVEAVRELADQFEISGDHTEPQHSQRSRNLENLRFASGTLLAT